MEAVNPTTLTAEQAAEKMGVSIHSIKNYVRAGHLRAGDTGLISIADIDLAIQLRTEFGRNQWMMHTPWYVEPEAEAETAEPESISLAARIIERAKHCSEQNDHEQAYGLLKLIIDEYDFGAAEGE